MKFPGGRNLSSIYLTVQKSHNFKLKPFDDIDDNQRVRPIWPYHGLDQSKSWVQRIFGDSPISLRCAHPPSQGHFAQVSLHEITFWRKISTRHIQIYQCNFQSNFFWRSSPTIWGVFCSIYSSSKFPHWLERAVRLRSKPTGNYKMYNIDALLPQLGNMPPPLFSKEAILC